MGYWKAYQIGGKLPWEDLFEPVIEMCEKGFKMWRALAIAVGEKEEDIKKNSALSAIFIDPNTKKVYKENDTIKMPNLAKTFKAISDDPYSFYRGDLAQKIVSEITNNG
jgi:gamma-glutamyltranspeptidase